MCDGGGGDSGGGFDSGGVGGDVSFDNNPGGTGDRYNSDHHHSYERTTHYNTHNSKSFFSKLPFPVVICFFVLPMIIAFGVGKYQSCFRFNE
jgi:hypothetical protein